MKRNKILLLGFVLVITYLTFVLSKHGLLSSISKSADYEPWFFGFFIWGTAASFAISGNSYLSTFAAVMLAFIGTATGYNEYFGLSGKQDILHVIAATGSIVLAMADILSKGWKLKKWKCFFELSLVASFGLFTYLMTHYQVPKHTYFIEVYAIIAVFIYFFYYNLKIEHK